MHAIDYLCLLYFILNLTSFHFCQSNLIIKQRILVGFMLKADLKDKALNIIADFILFLLSTNIIDMSREEVMTIIRDQVGVWINTKEAER